MYQRILMPTDGSACSEQALEEGLELARAIGAEVTFVHVLEDPATRVYSTPEVLTFQPELYQAMKRAAEDLLDRAMRRAAEAGVEAERLLVEHRHPVEVIVKVEDDHDLVVMGTHGRRGFNRFVFGSVAEGTLRRSEKPYLLIRCREEAEPQEV